MARGALKEEQAFDPQEEALQEKYQGPPIGIMGCIGAGILGIGGGVNPVFTATMRKFSYQT